MSGGLSQRAERLKRLLLANRISSDQMALAAYLGDADARALLTARAGEDFSEGPPEPREDFNRWLTGIQAYGHAAALRASVAYSRAGLIIWRAKRRDFNAHGTASLNYVLGYEAVIAAEYVVRFNQPGDREQAAGLFNILEEEPAALRSIDGLHVQATLMELFVTTLRVASSSWQSAFNTLPRLVAGIWKREQTRRSIVQSHLRMWALQEDAASDAIEEHPTQLPMDSPSDPS